MVMLMVTAVWESGRKKFNGNKSTNIGLPSFLLLSKVFCRGSGFGVWGWGFKRRVSPFPIMKATNVLIIYDFHSSMIVLVAL